MLSPFRLFEPFRIGAPSGATLPPTGYERFQVRKADLSGFESFQVRKPDDSGWEDFQVSTNG